jgi:hypothetical protein
MYYATTEQFTGSSSCVSPCSTCHPAPYIINRYLFFFPELRAAVILVSSPLALLVACWGMTTQGKRCPAAILPVFETLNR